MNKKIFTSLICFVLIISMLVTGCGGAGGTDSSSSGDKTEKKDTVTVVEKADLPTLDPLATPDRRIPLFQIYDTLVVDDDKSESRVAPALAESWDISDDAKEIIFHIRKDVKFHNGEPLTAEDVAFSINTSIASPFTTQLTSSMESAEAVDDNTVLVKLKFAYSPALRCFACPELSVVNKKAYEKDPTAYGREPVGTGPYVLKEWVPGDKLIFEAFTDYYKGEASIKNLVYKIIGDASTALIALEKGEVDVLVNPDPSSRQSIIDNEALAFYECNAYANNSIAFNNSKGMFSNPKIREAVSYAIDKDAIILGAKEGMATRVECAVVPGYTGYPENFKGHPYDPEKAKQLLAEAGYPDGFTVKMKTIDSEIYKKPTEIIQEQLRKIGIDVEIDVMARSKWVEDVLTNGDYDITFWATIGIVDDADFCLYSQFHSSNVGGNGNFSECKIPELDKLLEAGRASVDEKERKEIYTEACEIIRDNNVILPIYLPYRQIATNKDLDGVTVNAALKIYSYGWSWK